jgi:dipeptidyl-peptidase-4
MTYLRKTPTRTIPICTFIFRLSMVLVCACSVVAAAEKPQLSAEWVYGDGSRVADIPEFVWLDDGTALLYDTRVPAAQRTIEKLDPASGQRRPALNMRDAVASLATLVRDSDAKDSLPWPEAIDGAGKQAAYAFRGDIFLLDLGTSRFTRVTDTPADEKDARFSPDGCFVSYVRNNDLYVYEIANKKETRLTSDGSQTTLNGTLSWVYWEEVFGRRDTAYWWSPDSRSIAYLQTDESGVPVSTFVDFAPVDPRVIRQVYPKAGEKNPRVRVGLVTIGDTGTRWIGMDDKLYEWILRVKWLPDSARISVQTLNRAQTEMELYFADAKTGVSHLILTEGDPYWVNTSDDLFFLKDGMHFLFASERDGYMHLYRYQMDGTLTNQVTKGDWALASAGGVAAWLRRAVVGIDPEQDWIYFTALKESSVERQLYRIKSDGSGLTKLTTEAGTHRITMSPDARYYFDVYSNIRSLPALRLFGADGKPRETLAAPRPELLPADMQYPELRTIPADDGFPLPAQILKPKNFDPAHKYPVILYVYGMPSIPTIHNAWQPSLLRDQLWLEDGYVLMGLDARVSTGISKKLEDTYATNPEGSVTDLVAGVRWLKSQPWVDGSRFGVWGWSGGGTMTLTLMTHSKEFKAGIAGAPVTDWRYYDSKTAEMVIKLPQDNPEGYQRTSLVKRAADLSGHVMLIFGSYDDNVHPQNEYAFMNELIKDDKMFEVMVYPMRKHGFTDTAARIHLAKTMREFWRKNL